LRTSSIKNAKAGADVKVGPGFIIRSAIEIFNIKNLEPQHLVDAQKPKKATFVKTSCTEGNFRTRARS